MKVDEDNTPQGKYKKRKDKKESAVNNKAAEQDKSKKIKQKNKIKSVVADNKAAKQSEAKKGKQKNNKEYIIADDATPQGAKAAVHTKKKLPKTGGSNETVYFSGGAMLILLAIGMVVKRKENGIR